ncbi:hypothetical protein [Streptomyces goshikiensis]|uniref:hypothetical protein n=1 Tax=Streptomyces goshikiensis TaxID=1942 RepID=UPI003655C3FA
MPRCTVRDWRTRVTACSICARSSAVSWPRSVVTRSMSRRTRLISSRLGMAWAHSSASKADISRARLRSRSTGWA